MIGGAEVKQQNLRTTVDVVPVINVALVIVLTLMLISPFINEADLPVDLPEANTSEVEDQDKLEVICTLDGVIAVNGVTVAEAELASYVAEEYARRPELMAVVKADRNLEYGYVERIIATIEGSGAPRIALATDKKKREL